MNIQQQNKNLTKISSGQLMNNRRVRMDETVLENKRKMKETKEATTQKRKRVRDNTYNRVNTNNFISNQQMLVVRATTYIHQLLCHGEASNHQRRLSRVKQATIKYEYPIPRGKKEFIRHLQRQFGCLEKYLPSLSINEI